jgi:MoxR-vWA-beta-propeller ternary system domain bpX5
VTEGLVRIDWRPRPEPLEPLAAAADGAARERLLHRLRELPEDRFSRLQGMAGESLLVILGAAEDLPWVDGVVYLGRSREAPSLLLPTALEPSIPEPLLERAVRRLAGRAAPPLAVLPARALVASVAAARPLSREFLATAADAAAGGSLQGS